METVRIKRHLFAFYHPAVLFVYFLGAAGLTMLTLHPAFAAVSFMAGGCYAVYLKGPGEYLKSLRFYLPLFLAVAAGNVFFSGLGLSVLFYFGGNPVTWESVLYGLCSGGMLVAVLQWFGCCERVMTSDKLLCLFGRILPVISMMLAMIFRYIPEVIRRAKEINSAQAALVGMKKCSKRKKTKQGLRLASVLMAWTMENSMETADSMLARGYGSRKRSYYTNERLTVEDTGLLIFLGSLAVFSAVMILTRVNRFAFYPTLRGMTLQLPLLLAYALFLMFPLILEGKEYIM
ncbi:MAG TPA: hypothetical protein DEQ02_06630 [Ruminococcaceae bacterium]|nr:hypothetical protein [Oscillospiraceae bacterium]